MTAETDLKVALNFLANNWKHDQSLRRTIGAIFEKLEAGSQEDKANAQVLERYLAYPGSDPALESIANLQAALKTKQGRSAAKLTSRKRGSSYTTKSVTINDDVMQTMIKCELGRATQEEVMSKVIEYNGANAVEKTNKKFIQELKPIAKAYADFISNFFSAREKQTPL